MPQIALIQKSFPESQAGSCSELITQAKKQGADLVILPELHDHPYFCQKQNPENFKLAETIPGPSSELYSKLASELNILIVISIFELDSNTGAYYNTALIIERDGSIAGKYRKTHIPQDPGFEEKYYFRQGQNALKPIQTSIGKIGLLICWDQWFPEAARSMALAGADFLVYPTAIGWVPHDSETDRELYRQAWLTVHRAHSITNCIPVLATNRVGREGESQYWGSSCAYGPFGGELAIMNDLEGIALVTLDLSENKRYQHEWPFRRDLRPDLYSLGL